MHSHTHAKEPMHYSCKNLRWMWISKVFSRIKSKVLVAWNWNSVNEASMLWKDISNFLPKTMFFLWDMTKIISDQQPVVSMQCVRFM